MRKGTFFRNVATLASGTAMAQIILLLASPLLTRLYTPEDFGLLAIFLALVSGFVSIITGQYEAALVAPRWNSIADELFSLSINIAIAVTILLYVLLYFFSDSLLLLINANGLADVIFFSPVMLLFTGLFFLAGYYANRHRHYGLMAKSKLLQAVVIVLVNVSLGLLGLGFYGLLVGNALGLVVGFSYLIYNQRNELSNISLRWNKRKSAVAIRYKDYPLFSGSTGLLNGLALYLPTFFLAAGYMEAVVGYYALVLRVMNMPLTFLSTSVSQVNLKKISDLVADGLPVLPYVLRISAVLFFLASIPVTILVFFAPDLFAWIFGEEWREAGVYAQIMAPALVVRFVASTLSTTLWATGWIRILGVWKVVAFLVVFVVLFTMSGEVVIHQLLYTLMLADLLLYLLYFAAIIYSAKYPKR